MDSPQGLLPSDGLLEFLVDISSCPKTYLIRDQLCEIVVRIARTEREHGMIKRLYFHNFRCLENFELPISSTSSALLIGKNGVGKSSVGFALELLQRIARGTNRVRELIGTGDFSYGRSELPMRLQIEVVLEGRLFAYDLAFELPAGFKEVRVAEETLTCDNVEVYSRDRAQLTLARSAAASEARFLVDWHLVALPLIQEQSKVDPLKVFKTWLAQMMILAPVPCLITGDSEGESRLPNRHVTNLGEWFTGLIAHSPAAYARIDTYIRAVMEDFEDIQNPIMGAETRRLMVQFRHDQATNSFPFSVLSDGEKCFFIAALVLASNATYGPLFCFWDEPDNYLSLSEVGHFVMELRKVFQKAGGQLIVTSHNPEAIRQFSDENTLLLYRNSHLEPTQVRRVADLNVQGDLVNALIGNDVTP